MKKPIIQFENWPRWFAAMWPDAQRRWVIINSYRALARHPAMLADIALRNNVFSPIRETETYSAGVAEGRRQCALDIFKLARIDHDKLFEQTQKLDRTNQGDRT